MADRTFSVDIVTPDRVVAHDNASYLVAPGVQGSFGVLPNHAPLLSELAVGELRYRRENGEEVRMAVGGGFLQIFDNKVTALVDSAERPTEIDLERARQSLDRAKVELREAQSRFDAPQTEASEQAVARAQNRIRIGGGG